MILVPLRLWPSYSANCRSMRPPRKPSGSIGGRFFVGKAGAYQIIRLLERLGVRDHGFAGDRRAGFESQGEAAFRCGSASRRRRVGAADFAAAPDER